MKKYFLVLSLIVLVARLLGEQIVITGPGQIVGGSEVHFRFAADAAGE